MYNMFFLIFWLIVSVICICMHCGACVISIFGVIVFTLFYLIEREERH